MHRSKLGGFIIDCENAALPAAADFWGAALGMKAVNLEGAEARQYVKLQTDQHTLAIEVQRVEHASRVHLDIETDNIEAEVRRLEALGAVRVGAIQTWVVMQAPTGHRFCVITAASADFEARATRWQ